MRKCFIAKVDHFIFKTVMIFGTALLIKNTINYETNIVNKKKEKLLKLPVGWRLTSFLQDE